MLTIYIDNQAYQVASGQNLLQACLGLKKDLPYFCWHPAMGSVGACRQCAMTQYQDENDTRGRMIVACMTPVTDGMRVSMDQPAETEFRDQVISALMTHHPHDCPVCAEGGECHLQDMTVMAGHHSRHYKGKKTTFPNQQLGPLIKHEMNRCITCYRCVRFYQDYAGGTDLSAQASKNHVYFGRQCDGTLESEFAGNLVEVCPTGVFTDKPFGDHYSRKWDLQTAPSVCQHCSIGCNISLSERYGSVRRVTNRVNDHLNGYFLCDRGRYGFGFVNSSMRCTEIHKEGAKADWLDDEVQHTLTSVHHWIGIGSTQMSLEDNFALQQLVGPENFCIGLDEKQEALLQMQMDILAQFQMASLAEMEQADAIVILAEDINNSAPRAALAIRQALLNNAKSQAEKLRVPAWQDAAVRQILPHHPVPLAVLGYGNSALAKQANMHWVCDDKTAAEQGFLLANLLSEHSPKPKVSKVSDSVRQLAEVLSNAKRPLIVTGWSANNPALLAAAANIRKSLDNADAMLAIFPAEANMLGLGLLMQQGHLPVAELPGTLGKGKRNILILDHDSQGFQQQLAKVRDKAHHMVRLNQFDSVPEDEIELPVACFSEVSGSMINYQGRLQSYYPASKTPGQSLAAWQWLVNIARLRQHPLGAVDNLGELRTQIGKIIPSLAEHWCSETNKATLPLAMQPPRFSGRTAMLANQTVHEPKPFGESNAPYKQSMEGQLSGQSETQPIAFSWSPGWNSNQSNHKFKDEYRSHELSAQSALLTVEPVTQGCWFKWQPDWSRKTDATFKVLASYKVFGSDSLSLHSLPVQELMPSGQLSVNSKVAAKLGLDSGQWVQCDSHNIPLQVTIEDTTPDATLLVYSPANLPFIWDSCDQVTPLPADAVEQHLQQLAQHIDTVHEKQMAQKQRLLERDERIPIRFIEGVS